MFIRKTTAGKSGSESYFTYRLVNSVRIGKKVSQKTLLNLGRYFDVERASFNLPADLETVAQDMCASS